MEGECSEEVEIGCGGSEGGKGGGRRESWSGNGMRDRQDGEVR